LIAVAVNGLGPFSFGSYGPKKPWEGCSGEDRCPYWHFWVGMFVNELDNMRRQIYSTDSNVQLNWTFMVKLLQFNVFRQVKLLQQLKQILFEIIHLHELGHDNTLPNSLPLL
jgi:hypothetical protein